MVWFQSLPPTSETPADQKRIIAGSELLECPAVQVRILQASLALDQVVRRKIIISKCAAAQVARQFMRVTAAKRRGYGARDGARDGARNERPERERRRSRSGSRGSRGGRSRSRSRR